MFGRNALLTLAFKYFPLKKKLGGCARVIRNGSGVVRIGSLFPSSLDRREAADLFFFVSLSFIQRVGFLSRFLLFCLCVGGAQTVSVGCHGSKR